MKDQDLAGSRVHQVSPGVRMIPPMTSRPSMPDLILYSVPVWPESASVLA